MVYTCYRTVDVFEIIKASLRLTKYLNRLDNRIIVILSGRDTLIIDVPEVLIII